jgi:hypothetical protein
MASNPLNRKIRVGVLGAGGWAKFAQIPGFKRDTRCVGVALGVPQLSLADAGAS